MFDRFNPAAKRVMRAAEQACRNHNHYYLGVGHLLLALVEERDLTVEARFAADAVSRADVAADVRRALGTGDDRLWDGILVTPRVRSVIALAESAVNAAEPIGPVDLLDAIVVEGGGLAAEILMRYRGNMASTQRVSG